jgi:hypothetical protein
MRLEVPVAVVAVRARPVAMVDVDRPVAAVGLLAQRVRG